VNWGPFFNTEHRAPNDKLAFDSAYIEANYPLIAADVQNLLDDKTFLNSLLFTELNHGFYGPWFAEIKTQLQEIIDLKNNEIAEK
jgi:hypothetical protein